MTRQVRDPYEQTMPDPVGDPVRAAVRGGRAEAEASAQPEASAQTEGPAQPEGPEAGAESPPKVSSRDRRVLEVVALLTLLPALLVFQWLDDTNNVRKHLEPKEKVIPVARDTVGVLGNVRWRLIRRETSQGLASSSTPDQAQLRIVLAVRPLDATGVKTLSTYGLRYRLRDAEGHEWSATGLALGTPRAGTAMQINVRATVPRAAANSLELEVRPPEGAHPPNPRPLLRFAP